MKRNMSGADRIIRVILGIAIVAAGIVFESWWGLIGAILLGTAVVNWCPIYRMFGISSCRECKENTPS